MASAKVSVTHNIRNLGKLMTVPAEDMREIGLLARELIIRHTLAGVDEDGNAFVPYSPGYEAQKRAALGSAAPVNLQVSGNMLNHLVVTEVADNKVTLGWNQ
jgi:hypothetical protein